MIRLILFVVVGLLAGLGAGTGVAVVRAKSAFAAESATRAKVVADSLAEHTQTVATKDSVAKLTAAATADSAADAVPTEQTPSEAVVQKHASSVATPPGTLHQTPNKAVPAKSGATSGAKVDPKPSTPTVKADDKAAKQPVATDHAPVVGNSAAVHAPVTTAATTTSDVVQPKRISKIFAAMPAKDAAKVLVQMDDADVRLILGAMADKQAAAILINFPADRAATISKKAMRDSHTP